MILHNSKEHLARVAFPSRQQLSTKATLPRDSAHYPLVDEGSHGREVTGATGKLVCSFCVIQN